MKNNRWFLGIWVLAFVISGAALASDQSSGCGVGWMVTQRMSLVSSSIRETTNMSLPNTFSMTSGTSGCAKHMIVKGDGPAVLFAAESYDSISAEMAEGRGEYLRTFALALGCGDGMVGRFGDFTQAHYREIMQSGVTDGVSFYQSVRTEMMSDPVLKLACVPSGAA